MCGFYASALLIGSDLLSVDAQHAGSGVGLLLGVVSAVFIAVAVYVAAVVIANGVDTVIAGRLRQIAVLRLLGAGARALRAAGGRGATLGAAPGAVAGVLAGSLVGDVARSVLVARGSLRDGPYTWFPVLAVPAALVITLTAAAAARVGSRRVLRVSPAQALLGASVEAPDSRR